jgi:hypothetical protein
MTFCGLIERRSDDIVASSAFRTILFEVCKPTADAQIVFAFFAVYHSISTFLVVAITADFDFTRVATG